MRVDIPDKAIYWIQAIILAFVTTIVIMLLSQIFGVANQQFMKFLVSPIAPILFSVAWYPLVKILTERVDSSDREIIRITLERQAIESDREYYLLEKVAKHGVYYGFTENDVKLAEELRSDYEPQL